MQDELLTIWRETKKSILFVTHDIDEAIFLSSPVMIMSRRPGRVLEIVPVQLERHAERPAVMSDPAYLALRAHIWCRVRREVQGIS